MVKGKVVSEIIEVKNLVIGLGFSCIPVLREFDRTNEPYIIISEDDPMSVWTQLDKNNRLDFDLVSSTHTSFYSFDTIKRYKGDEYPIAKDFYQMHLDYYEKYKDKVVRDFVEHIDNYGGYSIVSTRNNLVYKAENVVIATGFKRAILKSLESFDYSITNKTIVVNGLGDSSNLMISKLISGNNRIILTGNGFVSLDKIIKVDDNTLTLDQMEYHNVGFIARNLYRAYITGSSVFPLMMMAYQYINTRIGRMFYKFFLIISRIIHPYIFWSAYPDTIRHIKVDKDRFFSTMPVPNGLIVIKYTPIDAYYKIFGSNFEDNFKKGFFITDTPMFIDAGLVEYGAKDKIKLMRDQNILEFEGKEVKYDYLIEGGPESPKLPTITIHKGNTEEEYKYIYRENYLGSVPSKLSNIFFIGWTRPETGGLANINEMQALLIHKMIVNDKFKKDVYSTIEERLRVYNAKYYMSREHSSADHLVYYGFFTEEVARAVGVNIRIRDCRSFKEVMKCIFFPNNAFKYRQFGEYKVDGCEELVETMDKNHNRYSGIKLRLLTFVLYFLMTSLLFVQLYIEKTIHLPSLMVLLALQSIFYIVFVTPSAYSQPSISRQPLHYLRITWLILGFLSMLILGPYMYFVVIGFDLLTSYILRQVDPDLERHPFNDLKVKRMYKKYLKDYIAHYRKYYNLKV